MNFLYKFIIYFLLKLIQLKINVPNVIHVAFILTCQFLNKAGTKNGEVINPMIDSGLHK